MSWASFVVLKALPLTPFARHPHQEYNVTTLLKQAYDKYGFISNELVIEIRKNTRLRVVQELQENISRSAVRSAEEESLFTRDELMSLHRVFFGACMKVGRSSGSHGR